MLTNYHTHHYRCLHATGEVYHYVEEAVKQGYAVLGMSCHMPYPDFKEMKHRMNFDEYEDYLQDIERADAAYPTIKVLKSLECEYFPHLHDYYETLSKQTDYLVLGQHRFYYQDELFYSFTSTKPEQLKAYGDSVEEAFATGLFSIIAHPDGFGSSYQAWDEMCDKVTHQIVQAALKYNVVLELNANGFRRGKSQFKDGYRYQYPLNKFWEIVAKDYKDARVIINSDCHDPKQLNDEYVEQARRYAKEMNLNVIEVLPL